MTPIIMKILFPLNWYNENLEGGIIQDEKNPFTTFFYAYLYNRECRITNQNPLLRRWCGSSPVAVRSSLDTRVLKRGRMPEMLGSIYLAGNTKC